MGTHDDSVTGGRFFEEFEVFRIVPGKLAVLTNGEVPSDGDDAYYHLMILTLFGDDTLLAGPPCHSDAIEILEQRDRIFTRHARELFELCHIDQPVRGGVGKRFELSSKCLYRFRIEIKFV